MRIELSGPDITQAEIDAVTEVLKSGWLSLGPRVPEFEQAMSDFLGVRHAIAVANGTCGLHLLMRAFGIGEGDEVISTPFSFIASTNCIMFDGGRPVLVDIDPDTWNIDVAGIESAVTPKTKAIIPVDVFGVVPDMDAINDIAKRHNLRVVEDSCEALGGKYKGRLAGSLADAGVFGFYPNKQITTGEGGMIVTDDDETARLCQSMRNQGRDTGMNWLSHERLGFNYRLSDVASAIGLAQLRRIEELLAKRSRVAGWYRRRLEGESRISMQKISGDCEISWFVFVVKLADDYTEDDRAAIIENLRGKGIGCSNYFAPIHLQAFYRRAFGYKEGDFPICERVAARTIALPFHGGLTESDVDEVCEVLKALL
ncbi:MAG: DegT/DnrJ/EryC1/StrS family aminotransferase [Planctomycetota bacterium]